MYNASSLTPFRNAEFELLLIRTGSSFIVQAPGLARALGYRVARDMIRNLPNDEKGEHNVRTPGGVQAATYVTEPGLYRLLASRRVGAITDPIIREQVERFQHWLFHVVLPALRRGDRQTGPGNSLTFDEAASVVETMLRRIMDGNDLIRALRTAGVLKQTGAPKKKYRGMFVHTGTAWAVLEQHVRDLAGYVARAEAEVEAATRPQLPEQRRPEQLAFDILMERR